MGMPVTSHPVYGTREVILHGVPGRFTGVGPGLPAPFTRVEREFTGILSIFMIRHAQARGSGKHE